MASRIKGITVEIGGDTTGLDKALKSVNSSIKTTQSGLKDVSKLLKLDPTNTELLTQKQKLLKDAIGSTKEKLDALKLAQEQAKAQLESGDLGQDKYDALQREIIETEQELKRLQEQAGQQSSAIFRMIPIGISTSLVTIRLWIWAATEPSICRLQQLTETPWQTEPVRRLSPLLQWSC